MVPHHTKGMYFMVEGMDNSGKGLQIEQIKKQTLPSRKYLFTQEPSEANYDSITQEMRASKQMGKTGIDLQMLFIKDREQHLNNTVLPALRTGKHVCSDRGFPSTFAYGLTEGCTWDALFEPQCQFIMPDIIIFYDVSAETSIERGGQTSKDITRFDKLSSLEKLRSNYLVTMENLAASCSTWRYPSGIYIIDASRSIDEVHQETMRLLQKHSFV